MFLRATLQALHMHSLRLWKGYVALLIILVLSLVIFIRFLMYPPANFPITTVIDIPPGTSITSTARILREYQVIRSPFMFRLVVEAIPAIHGVQSGKYVFDHPASVIRVAWNVTHGITGLRTVRLTFPEGTTVTTMADQLSGALPSFDSSLFKSIALPYEGYLFPDTYFLSPSATPHEVVALMRANYDAHTSWKGGMALTESEEHNVVILASILEAEGKTLEDKQIIAGILLKRISLNMPLQADATFGYALDRTGYVPTRADIEGDSPYNSYRIRGLPPTPINNPGETSLRAAVTPTKTPYLYYITGSDGLMHYAVTFSQHINNQKKYFK